MITPRRAGEIEVDLAAMLELVDFLGSKGVDSVTLFGSTGEFVHYTPDERSRFVSLVAKRSRVPVLANVSHSTLDGSIRMAQEAVDAGIAAVVVMPPYFFRYQADSLETYFLEFAQQVARSAPILLYNIPVFTSPLDVSVAGRLLGSGLFAGIKDSSGDWSYFETLQRARETNPFVFMVGNDAMYARARQAGASGVVSGVACAVPELLVAIDKAIQSNRTEVVERLNVRLMEFIQWIVQFPTPVGIKEACSVRGLKAGPPATPYPAALAGRIEEFRGWFRDWLKVVEGECRDG